MKIYEIHQAVVETWVYEVEAESEEEALKIWRQNPGEYQICSFGGGDPNEEARVVIVREEK